MDFLIFLYLLLVSFLISLKPFFLAVIDFLVIVIVISKLVFFDTLVSLHYIFLLCATYIGEFILKYLAWCEYFYKIDKNSYYYLLGIYYFLVLLYMDYELKRKESSNNSFPRDEFSVDESLDDAFVLEPLIYITMFTSVFILVLVILSYIDKNEKKKKAMPQLDIAIISYVLIVLIIFFIIGYLFTLVIINRIYYIVMIRNYFFVKFEFNLIQQLDNFLLKNNFLLYLLDLKVIGLSELLIENIINNFINYLLLIKKIYFKLNF